MIPDTFPPLREKTQATTIKSEAGDARLFLLKLYFWEFCAPYMDDAEGSFKILAVRK